MLTKITIQTHPNDNLINITSQIQDAVRAMNIQEGVCFLVVPHTTAAITINSSMDQRTLLDIVTEIRRLVPTRIDFNHTYDTPADAAGHIKTTLIGTNLSLIVSKGQVLLGSSQSILFFEFDGPRQREIHIRVIADS